MIKPELFFIESEHSLHILHTFLKHLHLLLKLDLLISLIIGMRCLQVLQLFVVLFLHFSLLASVSFLLVAAHAEKLLNMFVIAGQDVLPLLRKVLLDLIKLLTVVRPHVKELLSH